MERRERRKGGDKNATVPTTPPVKEEGRKDKGKRNEGKTGTVQNRTVTNHPPGEERKTERKRKE